jgi:hypothetical protein
MKEESSALTPVYLMSLYGKWQNLNLVETLSNFFDGSTSSSPRSSLKFIAAISVYSMAIFGMVKFLRREIRQNQ